MRKLVVGLALAFTICGLAVPSSAQAHQHQQQSEAKDNITVVVNLTKDKGQAVEMSFNFLGVSLSRGNETVLWLNSDGVKIAKSGSKYENHIKNFISKGGKVYVCPVCAQKVGVKKIVDGAEFAKPDDIFSLLSKDRVRVISW